MPIALPNLLGAHRRLQELHDNYVVKEADRICQRALAAEPNRAAALHLRGMLAKHAHRGALALACLSRAAALEPTNAEYWRDLGAQLRVNGRQDEALGAYLLAVRYASTNASIWCDLAELLLQRHCTVEAGAIYHNALHVSQHCHRAQVGLGDVRQAQGRVSEAREHYERALQLAPESSHVYLRLGRSFMAQRDWEAAIGTFERGLARAGASPQMHAAMGEALVGRGFFEGAVMHLRQALAADPYNIEVCLSLLRAYEGTGRDDALVGGWCQLAFAFEVHQSFSEAGAAYREALFRKPNCLRALMGLGRIALKSREPHAALAPLAAVLASQPSHVEAHRLMGWASALAGNLERYWDEVAWLDQHGDTPKRFEQLAWDGSSPNGKTVLLCANAGLGDTIHLARFAALLADLGADVVLECESPLVPLLRRGLGVSRVVAKRTPLPAFDVHAPLAAVPRLSGVGWTNIPAAVPYIDVNRRDVARWAARLGRPERWRIGLSWAGVERGVNAEECSTALATFAPLIASSKARFISLQIGPPADELIAPPIHYAVESLLDPSCALIEMAAVVMNLDLIITVDTMVAHLAGALGRPVWTLLPYAADWRWQLEGITTPWYPTMRLFRQTRRGDWTQVFAAIEATLAETRGMRNAAIVRCACQPQQDDD